MPANIPSPSSILSCLFGNLSVIALLSLLTANFQNASKKFNTYNTDLLAQTNRIVGRLQVAVDESMFVQILNGFEALYGSTDSCGHRKYLTMLIRAENGNSHMNRYKWYKSAEFLTIFTFVDQHL